MDELALHHFMDLLNFEPVSFETKLINLGCKVKQAFNNES